MKILIYGDYFEDNSGFAKELRNFIPTFLEKGHEVRQVALNYMGLIPKESKIKIYPTRLLGVKTHWAPEVLDMAIDHFKPDIVFSIGDYFTLPYIVPVMTKPRNLHWVHFGVIDGEPMRKEYATASGWVNYNLVQSKFGVRVLKEGQKKSFSKTQAELFYPPIDLEVYKPLNPEPLRSKYKTNERFTVLFVGRNQYRKNTPVLLEAVNKLKKVITNIQILLHSTPTVSPMGLPDGFDLERIVEEMNLKEYVASVKTTSYIPDDVMNEIYNSADCLCLPSFGEGFGLPIAEAFAVGLPVIGTNCSSITELLADGRGIAVNPSACVWQDGYTKHQVLNSDNLANAIKTVWENPVLRKSLREAGSKFVETLERKKVAEKMLEIFEKVIKEDIQPIAKE